MRALKLMISLILLLACSSEPVEPGDDNEPRFYPKNFLATPQSNTSILITWEAVSDATQYLVQAKTGDGSFVPVIDGLAVANDADWSDNHVVALVAQGVQQLMFTGLTAGISYDFVVYPYNTGSIPNPDYKKDGMVPTSSATTSDDVVVEPSAHVTGFAATVLSNSSIKVSWIDASTADKYVVLAKTGAGSIATVADEVLLTDDTNWSDHNGALNVNQSVQEVIFSGLSENTSYDFTIYPYNEGGDPDPNFKTDGTVPSADATTTNTASSTFDESLIRVTPITVSGTPFDITTDDNASKAYAQTYNTFSYIPQIVMVPSSNGGCEIGWHDNSTSSVKITTLNNDDTKNGDDLKLGTEIKALGGFAKKGVDYVYGYVSGDNLQNYTVSIVNAEGSEKARAVLTGEDPLEDIWSKQSPLFYGSGRIAIDEVNEQIGVYINHRMTWSDGLKHQAGLLKILNFNGEILGGESSPYGGNDDAGGSNWLYSHNFDTRLVAKDGKFALTGNGDAYPRAIPFRIIANGNITENQKLFEIDGAKGDNDTKTQLGGLVALDDGSYILTFSTAVGRNSRDVNFIRVGSDANVQAQQWLTNFASDDEYAINVKTAKYGNNFVVAWEQVSTSNPGVFKAMFAVVDANGTIIEAPQQFSNIRFNRGDDFINYATGDVGWAIGSGSTLKVYRLKLTN